MTSFDICIAHFIAFYFVILKLKISIVLVLIYFTNIRDFLFNINQPFSIALNCQDVCSGWCWEEKADLNSCNRTCIATIIKFKYPTYSQTKDEPRRRQKGILFIANLSRNNRKCADF